MRSTIVLSTLAFALCASARPHPFVALPEGDLLDEHVGDWKRQGLDEHEAIERRGLRSARVKPPYNPKASAVRNSLAAQAALSQSTTTTTKVPTPSSTSVKSTEAYQYESAPPSFAALSSAVPSSSQSTSTAAPTTTTTSTTTLATTTKASSSTSSSASASATAFKGKGTFFFQNGNPGACGVYNDDSTPLVALDYRLYGDMSQASKDCGRSLTITNTANGKSVVAIVQDACPSCVSKYSLDMSTGAFDAIGDRDTGILPISWKWNN